MINDLSRVPTIELMKLLKTLTDQEEKNVVILTLVSRIYVPFNGSKTYEEMLIEFGYKPIEKNLTRRLNR